METRWYLFPGQTLERTRIEDRGHALHVTKNAWGKITAHLDRNRLIQEAIEKEQAHRRALKEGSEAMTKNWDNSVENIRKRKEEERQERLAKTEEDKMQRFLELREEQEAIRQKYIEDAKKSIYISQGFPKVLTSALISGEVMFEREKQIEIQKHLKDHEIEVEAKYAEKVKEAAQQEKIENLEKERKIREKNIEFKKLYKKEMEEKDKFNKKIRENRIAKEREDTVYAAEEFEKIKKIEYEEDREKKALVKNDFIEFRERQAREKKLAEMEEKEQDLVIDIYSKAKHRIQCLRKKKEREMHEAMLARRELASRKVVSDAKEKAENEERILRKAQADKEQEEIEKLEAKEAQRQRLIKDRQEDRRKWLEREEKRKFEEEEIKKWNMVNRFKNTKVIAKYEQDKKEKAWKEILQYRKELFEQMAEKEEEKREEKEKIAYEVNDVAKINDEDRRFFAYAEECLEYARKRGRTTSPVERVIREYKKFNNLPMPIFKICRDVNSKNTEQLKKSPESS